MKSNFLWLQRLLGRATLPIACLVLLAACSPGKHPFVVAQICLSDKQGVSGFIREMQAIATEEKMEFIDGSEETKHGSDVVGYIDRGREDGSPTIHLAVQQRDGMGVTAINVSLPGYQVALGFSEGSNVSEARRFADRVINRLGQRWRVDVLPAGSSVIPDPTCK